MKTFLKIFSLLFFSATLAQTTIQGTVNDDSGQPIPGANIIIIGTTQGTVSDFDGNFTLQTDTPPPFKLQASSVGFETSVVDATGAQTISFTLKEGNVLDEIVVSASRTPERVKFSPVTVERMDIRAVKNSSAPSFYDSLENLKGVDLNTNSLTFKSVNTRGFATFANTRFMQLVDGMDNSSPALNFALGNLLGMSELDVNSVELLPGASSALYGANAFNGIMFMTSKNPFDDQGISFYAKSGMTSSSNAGDNRFVDVGIRAAHKFSEAFAAKVSFSWLDGTEWFATDYRDFNNPGATRLDPGYDGLNIYGDEVSTVLDFDELAPAALPIPIATDLGSALVSRTGYEEKDLMDYKAESVKTDVSLNFRPWHNDFEIVLNSKLGRGHTIYQGANRYSIKDFFMQQHKAEIRNKNFFARAYVTAEKAGNSYDTRFTAININRDAKSDIGWFTDYATGFIGANLAPTGDLAPIIAALGFTAPLTSNESHQVARYFADYVPTANGNPRHIPGSDSFNEAKDRITSDGNLATGSKFTDASKIYHSDVNYNLSHLIDFADIMVGGSWRQYSLNSEGTIYTDYDGAINYKEYGAYLQVKKNLLEERLKLTGSIRYDKSEFFDGFYSPRLSAVYAVDKSENHNFRASFQTGFRNPTTQDLFIGLDAGRAILVGSAPTNLDRYNSTPQALSPVGQAILQTDTHIVNGSAAYDNAFSLASVNNGTFQKSQVNLVKPEQVTAYEFGYRGTFANKINIDLSAYYNQYQDFISNKTVIAPYYGDVELTQTLPDGTPLALVAMANSDFKAFQTYTNSSSEINSYGASVGLNTKVLDGFNVGLSYTFAEQDFDQSSDPDFETNFNTPNHRIKGSIGKENLFENFGFNVNWRWNDEYLWQSTFADGYIPARHLFDAQINYSVPSIKSVFKLGGANILGKEYVSAPGAGLVGAQYFISWTINQ